MSDLISVIIPVYNGEDRLQHTLESVIGQTYENLEIILIDDGSTDRTPFICDEFMEKYPDKMVVKHLKNSGVSVARNTGLDLAKGKFIAWCDSDDLMDSNMLSRLHRKIQEYQADIVCEYYRLLKDGIETLPKMREKEVVYEGSNHDRVFDNFFDEVHRSMTTVLWDKLYKREIFDGIRFMPGVTYEDKRAMHHILDKAKKIVYLNSWGYTYFISNDGITSTRSFKTANGDYEAAIDRYEFLIKKNDDTLNRLVTYDILNQMVFFYKECIAMGEKGRAEEVKKDFKKTYNVSTRLLKFIRVKENFKFFLFRYGMI